MGENRTVMENQAAPPLVMLAPLAGITDLPFRNLVLSFGADRVVSEMVATAEAVNDRPSARLRTALGIGTEKTAVQIAGKEADAMAIAAGYAADAGAKTIDINMGCPAKKVTNGYAGAALMRDLGQAQKIISAVVRSVDVPVTLKMRLGWDEDARNAPELARIAEDLGVTMVTVHGRTRAQFYNGQSDWAAIRVVKDVVSIPVIANGDIIDVATAKQALALSGADGVMIGRAAQGRPWCLAQIRAALSGASVSCPPVGAALKALVFHHYDNIIAFYGEIIGVRVARKHLGWYMADLGVDDRCRKRVLTAAGVDETRDALDAINWSDWADAA
ncbi:MAG: tRNA dihydrouridine synthase DusB [Pseudomonadota bacterium]